MIEKSLIHIIVWSGALYLLLNVFAYWVSDKLIFAPQPSSYTHLPNEIRIATPNGETINAVYLDHPDAAYTILFSHGNAEDLGNVLPFMQQFYALGYSVLMYDYRGYGTSEGSASTRNAKQDVAAAYRWLVEEKKIPPETIISQGRSLGGGLAIWLAAHRTIGGLVAEATFVSAFRVKTHWALFPWDKFNNLRAVKSIHVPVLIMHGTEDRLIPFWHAKALYAAVPGEKMNLWIQGGGHNDYAYVAGDRYLKSFQSFMQLVAEESVTPQPH